MNIKENKPSYCLHEFPAKAGLDLVSSYGQAYKLSTPFIEETFLVPSLPKRSLCAFFPFPRILKTEKYVKYL